MPSTTITKKPENSSVEVSAEITVESVAKYRAKALKEIASEISIDGFRKGNIPESIIIKNVGEAAIMERTASIAVSDELPVILAREKILAIETPKVTITKLAAGNPITFTAVVTVMPEVNLPDYLAIAKKHNAKKEVARVLDGEVTDMENYLRRERAKIEQIEKGAEPQAAHEGSQKLDEKDLPPLDDDFAKTLGAESADNLRARMRENMLADKERKAAEKIRIATIEEIIEKSKLVLPPILIEHELDRMTDRLAHDVESAGSVLDAYLKSVGKTVDDFRKEWRESATKRAKTQVIVREIAAKENIKPDEAHVAHELEHLKSHHKDVAEAALRAHVESALLPDAVFRSLEVK